MLAADGKTVRVRVPSVKARACTLVKVTVPSGEPAR